MKELTKAENVRVKEIDGWIGGYPLTTYITGHKRVVLDMLGDDPKKSPEIIWRVITQEKCSVGMMLPLDLDKIVQYVETLGPEHYKLKKLFSGGQPLKQAQFTNAQKIAEEAMVGYGSTEIGLVSLQDITVHTDYLCGKPLKGYSVKILNEEQQECQPGETGILYVKGKYVFTHYFNRVDDPDPNTVKAFTKDGWFNTEDTGYFDEEGRLFVFGRSKDVIMYGGVVFYPGWLEARLAEHSEIMEACLIPVSDPVLYHNICACVKPSPGSDLTVEKLKEYCEEMFLVETDSESVPMPKFFIILDEIPETVTGKPDKPKLRAMAEEKFGYKEGSQ